MNETPFHVLLKLWRTKNKMTQRQAADQLGAALQTYESWEQGKKTPRGAALMAVTKIITPPDESGK